MTTLKRQEIPGPGYKRIASDQVEAAIRCLTRQAGQADAASSAIQQAQSVLALIEPDLPRLSVRRERTILARLIVGLDEMAQPTRLVEELNRQYKKSPGDKELAGAVKSLRKRWSAMDQSAAAMSSKAGTFNPEIYRLVADMAELRGHLDSWPTAGVPSDVPPRGLRRTYTRARRLANEPVTMESLGELINVLREVADQLAILGKACPPMLKAHRKLISRAADALNAELLADQLDRALRNELGKGATKALPKLKPLAQRIAVIAGQDLAVALAESPAALMKRMQTYWTAWRQEATKK
ncbi:MAG: hypothetical protein AB8C95_07350 [Phycisphaeraceae bacterium]